MESNDDNIDKQISLIENIFNYIESIIKKKIKMSDESSTDSLYKIIIEYYSERMDYDSEYFDPFAYVNDMNENILETEDIDNIKVLEHFNNYIEKVIDGDISEYDTIISLYRIIKFYYSERVLTLSKYFDSYAFINDLNDVLEELEVSEMSDSEMSEDSSESEEENGVTEVDPYLSKFIKKSNNEDILLYQRDNKYIHKLDLFLKSSKDY